MSRSQIPYIPCHVLLCGTALLACCLPVAVAAVMTMMMPARGGCGGNSATGPVRGWCGARAWGIGRAVGRIASPLPMVSSITRPATCSTFFVGGIQLGNAPGARWVTPVELAGGNPNSDAAKNLTRFLMALDNDGNLANGIVITQAVRDAAAQITSPASSFAIDEASFNGASPGPVHHQPVDATACPRRQQARRIWTARSWILPDGVLGNDGCGSGRGPGRP